MCYTKGHLFLFYIRVFLFHIHQILSSRHPYLFQIRLVFPDSYLFLFHIHLAVFHIQVPMFHIHLPQLFRDMFLFHMRLWQTPAHVLLFHIRPPQIKVPGEKGLLLRFLFQHFYVLYPGVSVAFAAGFEVVVDKRDFNPADTRTIYAERGQPPAHGFV